MPIYPVKCVNGHHEDQHHRMPPAGGPPAFLPCETCGGEVQRVITPFYEVGTGNTMHQIVDRVLSRTGEPMVFNTRREWEAAMKREGVRPCEPGDARAQVKAEAERYQRCREEQRKATETRVEKAIDKAIERIGGAP